MKTAVLIPCYNEELTIKKVVTDFKRELPHADIYVYDNNSTDNSYKIAKDAGAIVKREYRQGKGNVVRSMFRDIDADCYIMVDGDDTYGVEVASEIEKLVLSGKADMVIGNRLSGRYFEENKRRFHNVGNKLVRKAINILFKSNLGDIMTGMRGFSYRFAKSYPISSQEFEIETEMTIFALNNNFLIEEVQVEYRDRIEGSESKLNTYRDGFKVLSLILSLFRDTRPLFFFSLTTFVLLLIAAIYFLPIFINYLDTGYVEKIPTLIVASTVVVIAVVIFFSGVVLHVLKKQHQQRFEQFLNMVEMKKRELENHR